MVQLSLDEYLNVYNLRMDDKLNTVNKDLNRVYEFWEKMPYGKPSITI